MSCKEDEDLPPPIQKARYLTADAAGNVYELVISQTGRYVGQANDDYKLGIWTNGEEAKTSNGTVATAEDITGGKKFGLKKGSAAAFNVSVSDSWITAMEGTIPLDNNTTEAVPSELVERGTIANNDDVVYDAKWGSNNNTAKAIEDFGYELQRNNDNSEEEGEMVHISEMLPGSSIKVIGGKVALTLGNTAELPDDAFESLNFPDDSGISVTPPEGKNAKMLRQTDPFFNSDGTYILACVKAATQSADGKTGTLEYSMLAWTDIAFSISGQQLNQSPEVEGTQWTYNQKWVNCSAKKGWNYYLVKSEYNLNTNTVTETYSVPADSSRPPAGYKWTVIAMTEAEKLRPYPNLDGGH